LFLDGALSDPLPIERAMKDGFEKFLIVFTRNSGYRKPQSKVSLFMKYRYRKYPNLLKLLEKRSETYNRQLELIETLERQGKAKVLRPSQRLQVESITKDKKKLLNLYYLGYSDCKKIF